MRRVDLQLGFNGGYGHGAGVPAHRPSVRPSVHPSTRPPVRPSVQPPVQPSVRPLVHLSVWVSPPIPSPHPVCAEKPKSGDLGGGADGHGSVHMRTRFARAYTASVHGLCCLLCTPQTHAPRGLVRGRSKRLTSFLHRSWQGCFSWHPH